MALPVTGLGLSHVISYINGAFGTSYNNLLDVNSKFDPHRASASYYVPPIDSLADWRGYNNDIPTIQEHMRTVGDNIKDAVNKGTPTIDAEWTGLYDLPILGAQIKDGSGNNLNLPSGQRIFGVQRYPSVGNEYCNVEVDASGVVIWVSWVTDETTAPASLSYVNTLPRTFILKWVGECEYHDLSFSINVQNPANGQWEWVTTIVNDKQSVPFNFEFLIENSIGDNYRISTTSSSGSPAIWVKTSLITVSTIPSYNYSIHDSGQGNTPCGGIHGAASSVWGLKPLDQMGVGDTFYTNYQCTTHFNSSPVKWWRSPADTIQFRVDSDGYISGKGTTPC